MSGLEKIIEHITGDAQAEADQLTASARAEADRVISAGKEEAAQMVSAIAKQKEADVAAAVRRIQSACELREKRMVLQAKQERIEDVFRAAVETLTGLGTKEYWEIIGRMIGRYASGEQGEIFFNEKDLSRLTDQIRKTAQEHHLSIGKTTVDIPGGFVLSYGDIEENCSFDVLIDASREELQDSIGQLLFGSGN